MSRKSVLVFSLFVLFTSDSCGSHNNHADLLPDAALDQETITLLEQAQQEGHNANLKNGLKVVADDPRMTIYQGVYRGRKIKIYYEEVCKVKKGNQSFLIEDARSVISIEKEGEEFGRKAYFFANGQKRYLSSRYDIKTGLEYTNHWLEPEVINVLNYFSLKPLEFA